jgi:hypothetical protein
VELLDRYLNAVKNSLPKAQQDDIVAEISDAIQSEAEEKEAQLGRPLTRDEEAELLKAYGNPRLVASRYGGQQYLIGPAFLPFYWYTLRVTLIVAVITAFILSALGEGDPLLSFGIVWGTLFMAVGVVTVVFAVLEYVQRRFGRDVGVGAWDPRKLPANADSVVPLSHSIAEVIIGVAFIAWLINAPWTRHALFYFTLGPVATEPFNWPFHLNPIWQQVVLPIAALLVLNVVLNIVNLVRPDWFTLRAYVHAAIRAGFFVIAAFVLGAHPLVSLSAGAHHTAHLLTQAKSLEIVARWTVASCALVYLILVYCDLRPLFRGRKRLGAASPVNGLA